MPMMPRRKTPSLVVVLLALLTHSAAAQSVEVTYIGNTGFMISSGKVAILIDAMFDEGWNLYLVPSRSTRRDMKLARPPFDDVDAILVTHWHDDHFDANLAAEHLLNNPRCVFVGANQVVNRLKDRKDFAKFETQIREVTPSYGEAIDLDLGEVALTVLSMRHVPYPVGNVDKHRDVQNLGFIATIGGVTLLHAGDAILDLDPGGNFVESAGFTERFIDLLFVQYFDRSEGTVRFVNTVVRPEAIVMMHVPPKDLKRQAEVFSEIYPNAVVFDETMVRKALDFDRIDINK
jgi:L-ascorbate metabolism protein UlaG (beta-lactamase superfamily)